MESKNNISLSDNSRVNEILQVILSFARRDFDKKVVIRDDDNLLDGIGAGVNMLGEELEHSQISLEEKEQLLKEVHHRVKNNMQIISSLLNLQSDKIVDEKVLSLIRDSQNRIKSMALVHEMLYKSHNLSKIALNKYVENLCKSIGDSYSEPESYIEFIFDFEKNLFFDIDKMILLGLILNEIISNSLKYAFPNKMGKISVVIQTEGNQHNLIVNDNGIGLKRNFDLDKDSSLGIQLIYMLVEQLEGKVKFENQNGVSYSITFY